METKTGIYMGRRITSANKLGYFWRFENDDPCGYFKNIAPAVIGESWKLKTQGTSVIVNGKDAPAKVSDSILVEKSLLNEWIALDAAAYEIYLREKMNKQLAKRKTQFDQAIMPLRILVDSVRSHDERGALIQRITSELWRRL